MAAPNQYGVFQHSDCETVILTTSKVCDAKIYLVVDENSKWRASYAYDLKDAGCSGLPKDIDKAYDTRKEALQKEVDKLSRRLPDYKHLWEKPESIEISLF